MHLLSHECYGIVEKYHKRQTVTELLELACFCDDTQRENFFKTTNISISPPRSHNPCIVWRMNWVSRSLRKYGVLFTAPRHHSGWFSKSRS